MKKILFINASPNKDGNTVYCAEKALGDLEHETLHLVDYHISQYGAVGADDQIEEVFARIAKADVLVVGSPVYWYSVSGIYKTFMDRWYMLPAAEVLNGKELYFFAQGSNPSKEAVDTIDYLIRRSSMLTKMDLKSLIINTGDVSELEKKLRENF